MAVSKDNGKSKEKYRHYAMRRMLTEAHTTLRQMAIEYDCTLEEMVNYALRVGIWNLKKVDVDPNPTRNFQ